LLIYFYVDQADNLILYVFISFRRLFFLCFRRTRNNMVFIYFCFLTL